MITTWMLHVHVLWANFVHPRPEEGTEKMKVALIAVSWAGLALTAGPRYSAGQKECHKTSQTGPLCDLDGAKQKQSQLFLWSFMESCLMEHNQYREHGPDHQMVTHPSSFATWVTGVSLPIMTLPYFTLLPLDKKLLRYLRIVLTFW